ncbi:hypothetical protein BJ170DRAFT_341920 [Xylariales sp. AK1849]|nr:hypothetical protein BJ170DRAFT_341920 [Xylariales sp. AK1849]
MSQKLSPQAQTVNALLEGYGSLSVPKLLAPLAENFVHQVLPASLDMPVRDKGAFSQHAAGVFGIFDKFQMIPKAVYEDIGRDVVVVHAHMQGTLKRGASEWRNECVMMIHLSADGSKILAINEFVDSAKAVQMQKKHAPEVFASGGPGKGVGTKSWLSQLPSAVQIIAICIIYQLVQILLLRLFGSREQPNRAVIEV